MAVLERLHRGLSWKMTALQKVLEADIQAHTALLTRQYAKFCEHENDKKRVKDLEKELASTKADINSLDSQNKAAESRKETLQAEEQSLMTEISELSDSIEKLKVGRSKREAEHKKEFEQWKKNISEQEAAINTEKDSMLKQIQEKQKLVRDLNKQLEESNLNVRNATKLQQDRKELEDKAGELKKDFDDLTERVKALRVDIVDLENKERDLKIKKDSLQSSISNLEREIGRMEVRPVPVAVEVPVSVSAVIVSTPSSAYSQVVRSQPSALMQSTASARPSTSSQPSTSGQSTFSASSPVSFGGGYQSASSSAPSPSFFTRPSQMPRPSAGMIGGFGGSFASRVSTDYSGLGGEEHGNSFNTSNISSVSTGSQGSGSGVLGQSQVPQRVDYFTGGDDSYGGGRTADQDDMRSVASRAAGLMTGRFRQPVSTVRTSEARSRSASRDRSRQYDEDTNENVEEVEVESRNRNEQRLASQGRFDDSGSNRGLAPLNEIVERNESRSAVPVRQRATPVLFIINGKPALKEVQPGGLATNSFKYCCREVPRSMAKVGDHRVYLHSQFQNPNQLATYYFEHYPGDTDPFFVLKDDKTINSGRTVDGMVPEWGSWELRQFRRADNGKRQILFLDFGLKTRGRIAHQSRWAVLERKKENLWEAITEERVTKMPPVQDWTEGFRQLEDDYGCLIWQMSIKGKQQKKLQQKQ